jgi:tetratricopeptide (TPR) repeat protein
VEKHRNKYNTILTNYFQSKSLYLDATENIRPNTRKLVEQPWQLKELKNWISLKIILAEYEFAYALTQIDKYSLSNYWHYVQKETKVNAEQTYIEIIENPIRYERHIEWLIGLLDFIKNTKSCVNLIRYKIQILEETDEIDSLPEELSKLAMGIMELDPVTNYIPQYGFPKLEQVYEPFVLLNRCEVICRKLNDLNGLEKCLGNQGCIYYFALHYDESIKKFKEQERICRSIDSKSGLIRCLGNSALLYIENDVVNALSHLKEQEELCRELEDRINLGVSLINQADIYRDQGNNYRSLKLLIEVLKISRAIGNIGNLVQSLTKYSEICFELGAKKEAITALDELDNICFDSDDLKHFTEISKILRKENI